MPSFNSLSPFSPATSSPVDVVVLCAEGSAAEYRSSLRSLCRVATTQSPSVVVDYVMRTMSPLLILDDEQHDALTDVCRGLHAVENPPALLITLSHPEAAGEVIDVCESILLKPFAPNLLSARVGRLLRLQQRAQEAQKRSQGLWQRAERERAKGIHLRERRRAGTLVDWPTEECPYCNHKGIVQFDHGSLRRAWYACASCRKVWLARRRE